MGSAISLREDYNASTLRSFAKTCRDVRQARRLLSLAAVYDGMNRADAAKIGGMDRQTLRDWVHRFNAFGPDGLTNSKGAGRKCRLSDDQKAELAEIVMAGPDPDVDGITRWRCVDLIGVVEQRFGVTYTDRSISNLLKALGFSHMSGRPQHPKQNERVIEAFKKTSPKS